MNTRVVVNDKMQRGYVYFRTEPMGRHFDPDFAPQLTPAQMRQLVMHHLKATDNAVPDEWVTFSERSKRVIETAKEEAAHHG